MPEGSQKAPFAPFHKWDRNFFLTYIAVCWLFVIMGFKPAVMDRFTGHADYPASAILQFHAILFPGWLVLITLQILLIRTRRQHWHKILGLTALAFIPLMVISGIWSEILSQRFYSVDDPAGQSFFIIPIAYMVMFPAVAGAALWFRAKPSTHKRLMLLANAVIVGAAFARWWGEPIMSVVGDGYLGMILNTFAGFYLIAGAAMAYDWVTRGRVHTAYVVTVPALIACHLVVSILYHSPDWRPVARWIAGI